MKGTTCHSNEAVIAGSLNEKDLKGGDQDITKLSLVVHQIETRAQSAAIYL